MSELALRLIAEAKRTKAKRLDLGKCGLTEIPKEIGELTHLEELILSNDYWDWSRQVWRGGANKGGANRIHSLQPLEGLLKLRILRLSGDSINWDLTDLRPIQTLEQLRELALGFTEVSDISVLGKLKQLRKLHLGATQVSDVSCLRELKELRALNLDSTQVSDVSGLGELKELQTLYLNSTQVSDVSGLGELKQLQKLYLSNTQVSDVSGLGDLKELQTLYLNSTQVSDVSGLGELKELQKLYLNSTQVSDVSGLGELKELRELALSDTQVSDVSGLGELKELQTLYLRNTQVSDVSGLSGLRELRTLDLRNTQVSDVSPLLSIIQQVSRVTYEPLAGREGLYLYRAPLTTPPIEVAKQGREAILNYFEELEKGTSSLYEAKLLIVGEGGAGKTTLARKLQDPKAPMPEEEEKTKGIDIEPLSFTGNHDDDFRMNVWDFGGQEIYYATHQFFLTKRSLYVLVSDNRKDDTYFKYWLHIIELLSENSPVIIIQNEKAGHQKDLGLRTMQANFDNILGAFPADLSQCDERFKKLQIEIQYRIQQLPHIGELLPKQWVAIREHLEKRAKEDEHITLKEYLDICKEHQITEKKRALFLSEYLHDLGVFLHFQDDSLLKRTVILQNEWATDAVYKVLDDKDVIANHGLFSREQAESIWSDSKYCDMHDELLNLMLKFELCYRIPNVPDEQYLAPQLLQVDRPEYGWDSENNLQLRYEYEFLPMGLFSRFLVRIHRYLQSQELAWKNGAILERKGTLAEVVEEYAKEVIRVRVRGPHAKELMTIISETFEALHATYPRTLRVHKKVPCNCSVCQKQSQPYFFALHSLERRKEAGRKTIECDKSFTNVPIAKLLEDIFVSRKQSEALRLFISYSSKNKRDMERFKTHLSALRRTENLVTWDDSKIKPNEEWDDVIKAELDNADIIVLLVTAEFIATDYIWDVEVKRALERREAGDTMVIPIVVRPCKWQGMPFAKIQMYPDKAKPIVEWSNQDRAWTRVIDAIKTAIDDYQYPTN